jgi:hypothetical protein
MRNLLTAFCVVLLLLYMYDKGHIGSKIESTVVVDKTMSLKKSIEQCQKAIATNECTVENIQNFLKEKSTNLTNSRTSIWSVNNELIDISSGSKLTLSTSLLHPVQLQVWESFLNDVTVNSKQKVEKMSDNNIVGVVIFIALFAIVIWLIFTLLPIFWKFFLNRVAEVSKAAKGEKID